MLGPTDNRTSPRPPSGNPDSFGGNDHSWTMNSLNRIEASIAALSQEVRSLDGKISAVDRSTAATSTAVAGMAHVNAHITETKVFMGKTDVRLEQMNNDAVTKGQLAIWIAGAVITSVGGLFAAGFWLAEKYILPLLDKLPPTP